MFSFSDYSLTGVPDSYGYNFYIVIINRLRYYKKG